MPGFALAKNCRVTALSRRNLDQARESAKQYNIPLAFDSAEAMCRSQEVDAVLVTTPNALHLRDVLLALSAGKPVLVEKPMGMNAGECRQMVEAAKKAKLLLGVAQVFRFENSTARLRDHVAAGDVGRVIFARSEFSYLGRAHARKWINERTLAGGGPIADVGVHCVDALRFILQDEVQTVSASANSDKDSKDVEAAAALALKFQSGTLAAVLVSMRADYRTPMEIVGEEAVLRADPALSVEEPIKIELRRGGKVEKTEDVSNKLAYARQVDAFADAVEGKAPFPVPGEEGWKNQLVLDAAYRSITGGRTEEVGKI